jgi:hypothetical protein
LEKPLLVFSCCPPLIWCRVDCNTLGLTDTGADTLADVLRSMFCALEAVHAISRNAEMWALPTIQSRLEGHGSAVVACNGVAFGIICDHLNLPEQGLWPRC